MVTYTYKNVILYVYTV